MRAPSLRTTLVAALAAAGAFATPALAQNSGCQDAQKFMGERQTLIQQLNKAAGKDKKLDPRAACSTFGKLVANGDTGMKWIEANKDWCQIPDQFAQSFKEDHNKIKELRGQACKAAAQMNQMEKQARQGSNPFGGGLTGEYKIPQGAL
ncbi:MAG TPA: hypothetical protein VGU45_10085 [Microvirga sp.]|jgi:hypothetical protein|nr:hypothetical protein [Microvirga sp.]